METDYVPQKLVAARSSGLERLQEYRKAIDEVSKALESNHNQGQLLILDVIGKVGQH